MSARLTVQDLQNSRVPVALNVCPTDQRFYQWLNESEALLLNQGRWWGSVVEAQFCIRDSCLTFPRQVATVEEIQVCGVNVDLQGGWYGFTRLLPVTPRTGGWPNTACRNGCGDAASVGAGQCFIQARMREGTVASFATTRGLHKVIRTYPTNSADVGKTVIYQGRDVNGAWVRTQLGDGTWIDGEQVTLVLPFVDTVTVWGDGAPVAVQKQPTVQRVLVYEYNTALATERALADYEPGETSPSYRQSVLVGAPQRAGCCVTVGDVSERRTTVTALVSLQHVDVSAPGDWLVLQNLSAYKAAMMAVKAWEEGDAARGDFYFYGTQAGGRNARGSTRVVNRGGAIPLLNAELRKQTGDATAAWIYSDETEKYARVMAGFI